MFCDLCFKMSQVVLSRSKIVKCTLVIIIFVLLSVILLMNDTLTAKVYERHAPVSCTLCSLDSSFSFKNNSEVVHLSLYSRKYPLHNIDIIIFFSHVVQNPNLKRKFILCLSSLLKYATSSLHFHILTDDPSLSTAIRIMKDTLLSASIPVQISLYDVNALLDPLKNLIALVRPYFSFKQGAYYSDGIFFLSIGLFKVMPLERVIIVDVDVKFLDDITNLYQHFEKFPQAAIIGIAQEQQPVYRHVLHEYRHLNNNSWIGGFPPLGFPGFNSGVLLMDLKKMKASNLYQGFLVNSTLQSLISKYRFKGHLGDQDFYTLISLEQPELFYTLPCTWNRQLCQWWRHHGYAEVFDSYYFCNGSINLLHGNCNSFIDDD